MAIPGTGAISFSQIQAEFGGANPISLSEYYAGGLNTPTGATGANGAVPGSGAVSISKYYGTQKLVINTNARAIFGYGNVGPNGTVGVSMTNLVSNLGVVVFDTTGVGTARWLLAAAGYGGDKAIFGYGYVAITISRGTYYSITDRVSNTGAVVSEIAGVGTARSYVAAAGYGGDRAIFGYGRTTADLSMTNKVSNLGVVDLDTTGVGTARSGLASAGYGVDKAIFGYGSSSTYLSMTNKVSNTGVVAGDTLGVGTTRYALAASGYGGDKAIFGYGFKNTMGNLSMTNLVSNLGVVAGDNGFVGSARYGLAASGYGGDKAIFGYGVVADAGGPGVAVWQNITNLVSNLGAVAADTAGVGTPRAFLGAATFG
jgi:hypothetical protein